MKTNKKIVIALSLISAFTLANNKSFLVRAEDEETCYVCLSSQNYLEKNANKMVKEDDYYVLKNIVLSSSVSFYVSNGHGVHYMDASNKEMKVNKTINDNYNIYFSPSFVYDEEHIKNKQEVTSSHVTFETYIPDSFTALINEEENELTYNSNEDAYDLYYLSEVFLTTTDEITVKDQYDNVYGLTGIGQESLKVEKDGYYRIKFTPGNTINGNYFAFNNNGVYGSGEEFTNNIYLEDSEQFYIAFESETITNESETTDIDTLIQGYRLQRDEEYPDVFRYISPSFFAPSKDYKFRYVIYHYNFVTGQFSVVDDDNNDETSVSEISTKDEGWYKFSFIDGGSSYVTSVSSDERDMEDYYLLSQENNFGFDSHGNVSIDDKYKFVMIEEDDELYQEDYDQYILEIYVNEYQLVDGKYEFYISNGQKKYQDGANYISVNQVGKYQILFSEEHDYGRNRHYRYSLINEEVKVEEVDIATTEDFLAFIKACNNDAAYSFHRVFNLVNDIDLSGVEITPIETFSGKFDGCFHAIKNLHITNDNGHSNIGWIKTMTRSASVSRLKIDNFKVEAEDSEYVGLVCKNYGTISKITINGSVKGKGYVGGLVGYNGNYLLDDDDPKFDSTKIYGFGTLSEVDSNVTVQGKSNVGGLIGFNGGKVISSTNKALVNNVSYPTSDSILNIGGIAGYSTGEIISCTNSNEVGYSNIGSFVGGITGLSNGAIYFCENNSKIKGKSNVGGIVGYYATLSEENDYSSYFGDYDYSQMINDFISSSSDDQEESSVQDLKKHTLTYCVNYGSIAATSYVGGIAGSIDMVDLTLKNSISEGDVIATNGSYAGGISGRLMNGAIKSSIASGTISSQGTSGGKYVGGITGCNDGTIEGSISSSSIKGNDYLGGIAGYTSKTGKMISNYSNILILPLSTSDYLGAISGYVEDGNESNLSFNDRVKYNYYIESEYKGIDGVNYGSDFFDGAKALTMEEMASLNVVSYSFDLNFAKDYFVGGDIDYCYPMLKNFEDADIEDNFDDSLDFNSYFNSMENEFIDLEHHYCRASITVTYMEWDENKGDVYDYDAYVINSIYRVYYNEEFPLDPAFNYTYQKNGFDRFDGKESSYFVSWNSIDNKFENKIVYAKYIPVSTSLYDSNTDVFVEGEFKEGTVVKVERNGEYYSIHFYLNGEEIKYENITVKVRLNQEKKTTYTPYYLTDHKKNDLEGKMFGKYMTFTLPSSDMMFGIRADKKTMPLWGTIVLSILGGAAIVGLTWLIVEKTKKTKEKPVEKQEEVEKEVEVVSEENKKVEIEKKSSSKTSKKTPSTKKTTKTDKNTK